MLKWKVAPYCHGPQVLPAWALPSSLAFLFTHLSLFKKHTAGCWSFFSSLMTPHLAGLSLNFLPSQTRSGSFPAPTICLIAFMPIVSGQNFLLECQLPQHRANVYVAHYSVLMVELACGGPHYWKEQGKKGRLVSGIKQPGDGGTYSSLRGRMSFLWLL